MPRVRAILFDLDGVLVDARAWHYEALHQALAPFGFAIPRREHDRVYDGLPTRRKLEILSRDENLPRGLHDVIHRIKSIAPTPSPNPSWCRASRISG